MKIKTLSTLLVVVALIFPAVALAQVKSTSVDTFQITTDATQQSGPIVYKNLAIWTDWRGGSETSLDIYGYDFETNQEFPIIVKENQQWAAGHNGKELIYNQYTDEKAYDVWVYDMETEKEYAITDSSGTQMASDIYHQYVVYLDGYGSGDLYLYDLNKETSQYISSNAAEPKIDGNYIVWYTSGPYGYDVNVYDYKKDEMVEIPNPDEVSREWANIDNAKVSYGAFKDGNSSIRYYDLHKNEEHIVYETSTSKAERPAISDKYIVWSESSAPHIGGVMGANLKTGEVFEVQEQGNHQNSVTTPAIWKNVAVWQAWRTGNGDIYGSVFDQVEVE